MLSEDEATFIALVGITQEQYAAMLEPLPEPEPLVIEPVSDAALAGLGIDVAWFHEVMGE